MGNFYLKIFLCQTLKSRWSLKWPTLDRIPSTWFLTFKDSSRVSEVALTTHLVATVALQLMREQVLFKRPFSSVNKLNLAVACNGTRLFGKLQLTMLKILALAVSLATTALTVMACPNVLKDSVNGAVPLVRIAPTVKAMLWPWSCSSSLMMVSPAEVIARTSWTKLSKFVVLPSALIKATNKCPLKTLQDLALLKVRHLRFQPPTTHLKRNNNNNRVTTTMTATKMTMLSSALNKCASRWVTKAKVTNKEAAVAVAVNPSRNKFRPSCRRKPKFLESLVTIEVRALTPAVAWVETQPLRL